MSQPSHPEPATNDGGARPQSDGAEESGHVAVVLPTWFQTGVCLLLGACGLAALTLGFHDLVVGGGFSVQALAAVLAFLGLASVGGVVALLGRWPRSPQLTIPALVGNFFVALYIALALASNQRGSWMVLVASVICAATFGAAVLMIWFNRHEQLRKLVVVAAVSGLAWPAFQFWYSNQYEPSLLRPHLNVEVSLDQLAAGSGDGADDTALLKAAITMTNSSSVRVVVLAADYVVTGSRVIGVDPTAPPAIDDLLEPFSQHGRSHPLTEYSDFVDSRLVQTGRVLEDGWFFEPGEETTRRVLVPVSLGHFDQVSIRVDIITANGNLLSLNYEQVPDLRRQSCEFLQDPEQCITLDWPVTEPSWVRQLIRGRRVVEVIWGIPPGHAVPAPEIAAIAFFRNDLGDDERLPNLSSAYEIARTGGADSLPLSMTTGADSGASQSPDG